MRGAPAAEIVPKAGLFLALLGAVILTLLKTLKTSPRHCSLTLSIGKVLNAERSISKYLGPNIMLKGALPYGVPAGGVTDAAVLNNACFVAILPRPVGRCGLPTTFGRSLLVPSKFVSTPEVTLNGLPDRRNLMP